MTRHQSQAFHLLQRWRASALLMSMAATAARVSAAADTTALPTVLVEAPAPPADLGPSSIAPLGNAAAGETPISIDVIPVERLTERGVNSLSSAMREEPAASDAYNTFGYVESLQLRGFLLDEVLNYQRDGLPVSNHAPLALENKQALEILQGTSGILAGTSSPGGLVDLVLKQPTATPLRQLTTEVSERGSLLVHGDVGGRTGDQDRFGYRVNLAAEERRPEVDNAWSRRAFGSGFFDWRLLPGATLAAEFERNDVRQISDPGLGLLAPVGSTQGLILPPLVDPMINLNHQPWTEPYESQETNGSLRWNQDLGQGTRWSARVASQQVATNDRIAFPDGCSTQTPAVYPGLCANGDVDLYDYRSNGERRITHDQELSLEQRFSLAGTLHEARVDFLNTRYRERYPAYQAYNYVGTINLFNPVAEPADPAAQTANVDADMHQASLTFSDVMRWRERFSLWLGARATRLAQSSQANDGSQSQGGLQHFLTPFGALGWQPWEGGYAYLSAGQGIETAVVPNRPLEVANPGAVLPALRSHQEELGFKQARAGGGWTAALFRITRPEVDNVTVDPALPPTQVAGARVARHQGLEFTDTWRPAGNWLVEARGMLLDARLVRAADPAVAGGHTPNVAPWSASLRADWQPPAAPAWTWSNQVNAFGRKPVYADDQVTLPAAGQWDSVLIWRPHHGGAAPLAAAADGARPHWTWMLGIDNVTNRRYWREAPTESWGGVYLFPAAPRTYRITAVLNGV